MITALTSSVASPDFTATVDSLLDDLFRCAQSGWAGGETTNTVTISPDPCAAGDTRKVWSKNGKWSGNNLHRRVNVAADWDTAVYDRDLETLDGMLTTHAVECAASTGGIELYKAAWVRQGRGYDLVMGTGCIAFHRASGTAYHAEGEMSVYLWSSRCHGNETIAAAIRGINRKLTAQGIPAEVRDAKRTAAAEARRERHTRQLAKLVDQVSRHDLSSVAHVCVTRADSLRAGNCVPGTDAFIDKFGFDGRDSATIGEIAAAVGLEAAVRGTDGFDLTLARQLAAACLIAIRKDKQARRLVLA